jgi:uncharacterized membrane protein YeaQ/YmgE (transglycosylase-associated protein family)
VTPPRPLRRWPAGGCGPGSAARGYRLPHIHVRHLLANLLIPGNRSPGLIITCLIGAAGALGGGWVVTKLFHISTLNGFFNLSTWLTAIAGSAVLLVIYRAVDGQRGHRPVHR